MENKKYNEYLKYSAKRYLTDAKLDCTKYNDKDLKVILTEMLKLLDENGGRK